METTAPLPRVDQALCTRCGLCVEACPCHAIEMTKDGPVFHCGQHCNHGGKCPNDGDCWCVCQEACLEGAIECPFEIVFDDGEVTTTG